MQVEHKRGLKWMSEVRLCPTTTTAPPSKRNECWFPVCKTARKQDFGLASSDANPQPRGRGDTWPRGHKPPAASGSLAALQKDSSSPTLKKKNPKRGFLKQYLMDRCSFSDHRALGLRFPAASTRCLPTAYHEGFLRLNSHEPKKGAER